MVDALRAAASTPKHICHCSTGMSSLPRFTGLQLTLSVTAPPHQLTELYAKAQDLNAPKSTEVPEVQETPATPPDVGADDAAVPAVFEEPAADPLDETTPEASAEPVTEPSASALATPDRSATPINDIEALRERLRKVEQRFSGNIRLCSCPTCIMTACRCVDIVQASTSGEA